MSKKTKRNANNIKYNNNLKHIHNYKQSQISHKDNDSGDSHITTHPIYSYLVETQDGRHLILFPALICYIYNCACR